MQPLGGAIEAPTTMCATSLSEMDTMYLLLILQPFFATSQLPLGSSAADTNLPRVGEVAHRRLTRSTTQGIPEQHLRWTPIMI